MRSKIKRQKREQITVAKMIDIYCKGNHSHERCKSCEEIYKYSSGKIQRCIFGENKPVCAKCKTHCYNIEMRETIRKVMRYSGPKMIIKHPILTLRHFIDSKRKQ